MREYCRLALAIAGLAALAPPATAQSFAVPPVQMAEPGDAGRRIGEDGLIGNWFPPAGPAAAAGTRRPAILLLGGSEGALSASGVRMARALSAMGYGVLQLSYFRAPGQSPSLELVPLELFDRALGWIGRQPGIDRRRLGVIGISKGGEAALLIASRNKKLRAVIAGVPSHVAWPGVVWDGAWGTTPRPSWSAGGQPLPVVPYGAFDPAGGIRSVYDNGLKALAAHPGAVIPLERARARILLVCGEADSLWPGCPMARAAAARAGQRAEVRAYADAGHLAFGVPVDPKSPGFGQLASLGGTAQGNAAARTDSWARAEAFLAEAFK